MGPAEHRGSLALLHLIYTVIAVTGNAMGVALAQPARVHLGADGPPTSGVGRLRIEY
jgi:hypothetical protein